MIYYLQINQEKNYPPPRESYFINQLKADFPYLQPIPLNTLLLPMVRVKDAEEILHLRRAVEITERAQRAVMETLRPGQMEYEVAALMEYEFKRNGGQWLLYRLIVGSGLNSTVLHWGQNNKRIKEREIVVVDNSAVVRYYGADITRTIPADGVFTPRQREVFTIVREAQELAMKALKPGVTMAQLDSIARAHIKSKGYGQYFIHGLSHWLGVFLPDPQQRSVPLQPGMVITIEPGIYIPEEEIGIRIEDDFLITENGYEWLSKSIPRTVEEIEAVMKR